jgi:hypothetical protein
VVAAPEWRCGPRPLKPAPTRRDLRTRPTTAAGTCRDGKRGKTNLQSSTNINILLITAIHIVPQNIHSGHIIKRCFASENKTGNPSNETSDVELPPR